MEEEMSFDGEPTGHMVPSSQSVERAAERNNRITAAEDLDSYAQVAETFGVPVDVSTWHLVDDKSSLVKRPFIIVAWQFRNGDMGEFVSAYAITQDNEKIVFNDGSTGILAQIHKHEDKHGFAPISCTRGLRDSNFYVHQQDGVTATEPFTGSDGKPAVKATTFYLA